MYSYCHILNQITHLFCPKQYKRSSIKHTLLESVDLLPFIPNFIVLSSQKWWGTVQTPNALNQDPQQFIQGHPTLLLNQI